VFLQSLCAKVWGQLKEAGWDSVIRFSGLGFTPRTAGATRWCTTPGSAERILGSHQPRSGARPGPEGEPEWEGCPGAAAGRFPKVPANAYGVIFLGISILSI